MELLMQLFPIFFIGIFALTFGTVLLGLVRGIAQWNKNNHSPRLTVEAFVACKRTQVSRRPTAHHKAYHNHTTYYATFQVESGDRFELQLEGYDYGMLVEGDRGKLSFQGTRFLGFGRT